MIAIVIPYYQKSAGVLRKALASVAGQRDCPLPIHVIVVDDASPAPAAPELESLGPLPFTTHIASRVNGGPGAARNTGLDAVPPEARYIAFLDSDDEWTPDHLARAICALDAGYDFYFADHYQLGQSVGAFARGGKVRISQHPALQVAQPELHAYQGNMIDQIIRGNLIGTSTVVFGRERFGDKRFKVEFTNAGEDYLFWMDLAHSGARIAFSAQCEARYGRGVNVYAGSGWGSEQHLLRVHNELKYRKTTGKLFPVTNDQQDHLRACVRELRTAFARDVLHRLAHRKELPRKLLAAHFKLDPMSFFHLPLAATKLLLRRP
jgi:succinoglycan biosynthesis protein ExoW